MMKRRGEAASEPLKRIKKQRLEEASSDEESPLLTTSQ
jgi:hypothetical protein